MNNVIVITNFSAGRKQAIKYKKAVLDFLIKRTKSLKFISADSVNSADMTDVDTIIVMGGDGTVNKVLPYLTYKERTLGIIPCGTANLLGARLGVPFDVSGALKIIEKGNIKKIDSFKIKENPCILRFGMGYDSDIIVKTPQSLKNRWGYFAYFIAGIIFALKLKLKKYQIIADNVFYEVEASSIIVANAPNMYRNLVSVSFESKLDDGLSDIFILKTANPIAFFFEFLKIIFNIRKTNKRAAYLKASNIKIKNEFLNCHIDGENKKIKGDIEIKVCEKSVKIFCA